MAKPSLRDDAQLADEPLPLALTRRAPAKVRLVRPYGFVDGDGNHRQWPAGFVISSQSEIDLLIERGAPVEAIES